MTTKPQYIDTITNKQLVEAAKLLHRSDDIEIDDGAEVSRAELGAWVQGWVWVEYDDARNK